MKTHAPLAALLLVSCGTPFITTLDATDSATTTSTSTTTSSSTSTTDEPTTSTSTSSPEPDLPPPCPVGSLSCPCTQGGSCDPGLACEDGACVEACAVGSLGCACTPGGGCDQGLKCDEAQTCVDDPMLSPPCDPDINDDDCCGDGVVDEFEDCDLAYNNNDAKECTTLCKFATCGDGFVQTNVEACDGGENCSDACTFTTCGDGKVDPWEWCEPRGDGDPECTALCGDGRKVIFVTSEHFAGGELGGVDGADTKCQASADSVALPGEFLAWIATSHDDSPLLRFNWLEGPYVDVNGQQIAATWDEVYYGAAKPPNITEHGTPTTPSEILWPHPFPGPTYLVGWASPEDGYPIDMNFPGDCGGWTSLEAKGYFACLDHNPQIPNNASTMFWVNGYLADCSLKAPIICVEQ